MVITVIIQCEFFKLLKAHPQVVFRRRARRVEQITCLGHWDLSLVTRNYFANRTRLSYIQFGFWICLNFVFRKEQAQKLVQVDALDKSL